jgi:hypothetical protein
MTRDGTAWGKSSGKISEIVFLNELLQSMVHVKEKQDGQNFANPAAP